MAREDLERIDDQGIAAWDRRDADAFTNLLADDFVWTDRTAPEPMRTKDQARQYAKAWFKAFPTCASPGPTGSWRWRPTRSRASWSSPAATPARCSCPAGRSHRRPAGAWPGCLLRADPRRQDRAVQHPPRCRRPATAAGLPIRAVSLPTCQRQPGRRKNHRAFVPDQVEHDTRGVSQALRGTGRPPPTVGRLLAAAGSKLQGFWYALSDHDDDVLGEASDNTAASARIAVAGSSACRSASTTVLLTEAEETLDALCEAQGATYRPRAAEGWSSRAARSPRS